MSLPIPLTVRLRTSRSDRSDIHLEARNLAFRWADPGGYASCTVSLSRPLSLQPDEIAYYGQMTVYDARNGAVVWDGRLEDPGRSAGADGQVWELTAIGGRAHTSDKTVPLIYVQQLGGGDVERAATNAPGATNSSGDDPGGSGKDAVILQFPQGQGLSTNSRANVRYSALARAGQKLARFDYQWDAGATDAGFSVQAITSTGGGASDTPRNQTMSTAGGGSSPQVVVTNFTNGRDTLDLRFVRTGAAVTVSVDQYWVAFTDINITAMRYNANATEKTTGYAATVLASDVVADLLGRLLTQYDGTNATIATTTHQIDQLAYPDGITAEKILTDLMALETGFTWRVWEKGTSGYRFEWVQTPSSVRYEADLTDGYESQGSSDGLYDSVLVRWRDSAGRIQTTVRTSTVPALAAVGLPRQGQIDLGTDVGSLAAAQRAGDQWLAAHQYAPNAGRLRIARPIVDLATGRMVQPWEIRPGLIRVRGVLPRLDALNSTTRDGVTVFRIVSCEYRASDAAATLELDSYARTDPQILAELLRNPAPTRRR